MAKTRERASAKAATKAKKRAADERASETRVAEFVRAGGFEMLLAPEDVGRLLHRSTFTLRRWRQSGDGPRYARIGNRIAYPADAVRDFVTRHLRTSTTDAGPAASESRRDGVKS